MNIYLLGELEGSPRQSSFTYILILEYPSSDCTFLLSLFEVSVFSENMIDIKKNKNIKNDIYIINNFESEIKFIIKIKLIIQIVYYNNIV